jgi:phosphoglycerol transferase
MEAALLLAAIAILLFIQQGETFGDWHVPVRYTGDALSHAMFVKSVLDEGWAVAWNHYLGAPFGAAHFDYPTAEAANILLIHVLGLFGDWPFVMNAYFLLGYFLVALSAYFALGRFGVSAPWRLVGSLLFTFLPYHALRIEHLFLASYFAIPLGAWLAWSVWHSAEVEARKGDRWATWICGLIVGSSGIYYAFFSCYLIVAAALLRMHSAEASRTLRRGALVLAIVVGTVLLQLVPTFAYRAANGPNPEVAQRSYGDTEVLGLKIIQMVLPRRHHRIDALAETTERYYRITPWPQTESVTSSLGIVATAGFLLLTWIALRKASFGKGDESLYSLSALCAAAVLLGTVGGFSAVFSFFVSAQIRCYNRISVLVAFLALSGLMLMMSGFGRWVSVRRMGSSVAWIVAALVAVIGVLDQTSPMDLGRSGNASFISDRAFVQALERQLEPDAMVYQLPYHRFPEVASQFELESYGPARGYLNSTRLRWSYGSMKGREGDRWLRALSDTPLPEQVRFAAQSGFRAIVLDRRGYADHAKQLEALLQSSLGGPALSSEDGWLVAYKLPHLGDAPVPLESLLRFHSISFASTTLPVSVRNLDGFAGAEAWGRWSVGEVARIELSAPLPRRFTLIIATQWALGRNVGAPIQVRIGNAKATFKVGAGPSVVELPFVLEENANEIELAVPHPVSPAELGMNPDVRKLGVAFKSIAIRE